VLLVHRVEVHKTTNTAQLAGRVLTNSTVLVRGAGAHEVEHLPPSGPHLVLFPAPSARVLGPSDARPSQPVTLVVPDGSWSQARRMARRDPACTGGELVQLPDPGESRYDLRRSPRPGGLCTLEAVARALALLEGPEIEPPLVAALDRFIERVHQVRRLGTRFKDRPAGPSSPPPTP